MKAKWPAIVLVVGVAIISLAGYFEHRANPHGPAPIADAGADA
jgi:hypothetical protein